MNDQKSDNNDVGAFGESTKTLRYTYDRDADAAYLYLREIARGQVSDTYTCDDLPPRVKGDINLDFDKDGRLLGVEVLNASKILGDAYTKTSKPL